MLAQQVFAVIVPVRSPNDGVDVLPIHRARISGEMAHRSDALARHQIHQNLVRAQVERDDALGQCIIFCGRWPKGQRCSSNQRGDNTASSRQSILPACCWRECRPLLATEGDLHTGVGGNPRRVEAVGFLIVLVEQIFHPTEDL